MIILQVVLYGLAVIYAIMAFILPFVLYGTYKSNLRIEKLLKNQNKLMARMYKGNK